MRESIVNRSSKAQTINIAMICDENFVVLTKTSIRSIIAHRRECTQIRIIIVGIELTDKSVDEFNSLSQPGVSVSVIRCLSDYEEVGQKTHRVSKAALFKFQLPNLVRYDKCLYMDGDVIVLHDLSDLYNTNIENVYAAMAIDWVAEKRQKDHIRLQHRNYFNSGVILMNLKKMRRDNIPEKLLEDKIHDTCARYMDQDAFNRVLYPHIVELNEKYNFHEEYDRLKNEDEDYAYLKTIDDIVCRHYTKYKPTKDLKFPHSEQFWRYGDVSDFMLTCIKNMRDDYERLHRYLDEVKNEYETLKREISSIKENMDKTHKKSKRITLESKIKAK